MSRSTYIVTIPSGRFSTGRFEEAPTQRGQVDIHRCSVLIGSLLAEYMGYHLQCFTPVRNSFLQHMHKTSLREKGQDLAAFPRF